MNLERTIRDRHPIFKLAWDRSLLWAFAACTIWGLFPIFFNGPVSDFVTKNPEGYMLIRYSTACLGFIVILIFLYLFKVINRNRDVKESNNRADNIQECEEAKVVSNHKVFRLSLLLVAIALFTILARYFEILVFSYGNNKEFLYFGLVFSVFLVPFTRCRKWFAYWVKGCLIKCCSRGGRRRIAAFSKGELSQIIMEPYPSFEELLLWLSQSTLIISSGVLILYLYQGEIPMLTDAFLPFIYCVFAAICMSFYYGLITLASKALKAVIDLPAEGFRLAALQQALVMLTITIILLPFAYLKHGEILSSFKKSFVSSDISEWNNLFLFGGIIFCGTCVAFVFQNYGLVSYERRKKMLGDRCVKEDEWAGLATVINPLTAVLVVSAMTHLQWDVWEAWLIKAQFVGKIDLKFNAVVFICASFCIFSVGAISFSRLWLVKLEGIRKELFADLKFNKIQKDLSIRLKNLFSVTTYQNRLMDSCPELICELSLSGLSRYSDWQKVLKGWSSMSSAVSDNCSLLVIKNGNLLFSESDVEKKEVLSTLKDYLIQEYCNQILTFEEVKIKVRGVATISGRDVDRINSMGENQFNRYIYRSMSVSQTDYLIDDFSKYAKVLFLFGDSTEEDKHYKFKTIHCVCSSQFLDSGEFGVESSAKLLRESLTGSLQYKSIYLYVAKTDEEIINEKSDSLINWSCYRIDSKDYEINEVMKGQVDSDRDVLFLDSLLCKDILKQQSAELLSSIDVDLGRLPTIYFYNNSLSPENKSMLGLTLDEQVPSVILDNSDSKSAFNLALKAAILRNKCKLLVYVIDDKSDSRKGIENRVKMSSIGIKNLSIIMPTSFESAIELLRESNDGDKLPLVLYDEDLCEWVESIRGSELLRHNRGKVVGYLFTRDRDPKDLYNEERITRIDVPDVVAKHLGGRGEHSPWSSIYKPVSRIKDELSKLLVDFRDAKEKSESDKDVVELINLYLDKVMNDEH